jgi:hypothetical protein
MSLNLLDIFTTTFNYEFRSESGVEVLTISASKFVNTPFLSFSKRSWKKEFKNQWNVAEIAYHLFTTEKIMEIKFSR